MSPSYLRKRKALNDTQYWHHKRPKTKHTTQPISDQSQVQELAIFSVDDMLAFAKKFRTSPGGVIVGQLQHEGVLHWGEGNGFKVRVGLF